MFRRLSWLLIVTLLPIAGLVGWGQEFRGVQTKMLYEGGAIVIDAVLYDGYEYLDADEAVALRNVGDLAVDLSGWSLGDGGISEVILPPGISVQPESEIWVAKSNDAFLSSIWIRARSSRCHMARIREYR